MTYTPATPRVGNELLIAVTSAYHHPYPRLAGTERTTFIRERPGQLGYVWEWTIVPTYPGTHDYTFYVDSTIPCTQTSFQVERALATSTPRVATFGFADNGSGDNSGDNGDNGDNGAANVTVVVTATSTAAPITTSPVTPTATPTATSITP